MIFLTSKESRRWRDLGAGITSGAVLPGRRPEGMRRSLLPHFHFYAGSLLASTGRGQEGLAWFRAGSLLEADENLGNSYMVSFMERHGEELRIPEKVFSDPRPYVHFTSVPIISKAREQFIAQAATSLPDFAAPFRFIDIGCGDGGLTALFLRGLQDAGCVGEIARITLVDPFPAMLELAAATVKAVFPGTAVETLLGRFQDVSAVLPQSDVALAALSIHHMPREVRQIHLEQLASCTEHVVLFEMNANNDTPELNSPELAVSIYQSYGSLIDAVFAHDAPLELAVECVDRFLLAEVVSILTEPRGVRTDYHMLRSQWKEQFAAALGPEFSCFGEFTAYATDSTELITLHYGRAAGIC